MAEPAETRVTAVHRSLEASGISTVVVDTKLGELSVEFSLFNLLESKLDCASATAAFASLDVMCDEATCSGEGCKLREDDGISVEVAFEPPLERSKHEQAALAIADCLTRLGELHLSKN